jgi:hypothetical protein
LALDQHLTTPRAILVAGALLAAGVFVGLRSIGSTSVGDPAVAQSSIPAPRRPTAAELAPGVAQFTQAVLERQRPDLVEHCVKPALVQAPTHVPTRLTFNLTYGADGKQITRGVQEERATSWPQVTQCVQARLPPFEIEPPGVNIPVDVVLTLP